MNHTKLNFGKIVHSIKETEKNCVVFKNTYLNNKTVKGIGLMQFFSVKRLCLILLNMYSLFLCIVYVPLRLTARQLVRVPQNFAIATTRLKYGKWMKDI